MCEALPDGNASCNFILREKKTGVTFIGSQLDQDLQVFFREDGEV